MNLKKKVNHKLMKRGIKFYTLNRGVWYMLAMDNKRVDYNVVDYEAMI